MRHHSKSEKKRKTNIKSSVIPDTDLNQGELQELLWAEIGIKIKAYLKTFMESILKSAQEAHLNARSHERAPGRTDYRNGSYQRAFETLYGSIGDLNVPRVRFGSYEHQLFDQYQRRAGSLDQAIGTLFLNGVSTRKLEKIAKEVMGVSVSSSTVSSIAGALADQDIKQLQEKELLDDYRFLFIDGISSKVREIGVERKILLCAVGVKSDGAKEVIGARLADGESEKDWEAFLIDLKTRGLKGKKLELITTDGCPGMIAALKTIYPYIGRQRCIAHKLRNVAVKIKRSRQAACLKGAKLVFAAPSRAEAVKRFKVWKAQWEVYEESAVRCLEKDLFECLAYFKFPKNLWKKIRTTNVIERSFREIRRRTRPMSIALPQESTERLFASLSKGLNQNWKNTPLKFTHKC